MLALVGLSGRAWNGDTVLTMSADPESTLVCSRVWYGPLTLAAVCSWTWISGYFFWNSASIFLIAVTAGGLTQVMIFRLCEPPPEEPLEQAAASSVRATARMAASRPLVLLRGGSARIRFSLVAQPPS